MRPLVVALLMILPVVGCRSEDEDRVCTLMGCSSGVSVDMRKVKANFPAARRVRLCVEDVCHVQRVCASRALRCAVTRLLQPEAEAETVETVRFELLDRRGEVLTHDTRRSRLEARYPNGRECGAACFAAAFRVDPGTGRLLLKKTD